MRPTATFCAIATRSGRRSSGPRAGVNAIVDGEFSTRGESAACDRAAASGVATGVRSGHQAHHVDGRHLRHAGRGVTTIAEALELELTDRAPCAVGSRAGATREAYDAYFRGRLLLLTESLDEANLAIEWFKKARRRSHLRKAYAGLADAYARIGFTWAPEADYYDEGEEMCDRALALEPNQLPEGRYFRGGCSGRRTAVSITPRRCVSSWRRPRHSPV